MRIWNANDRALHHTRQTGHHFFHLVGVDVEAADQDHVLLAVHDAEVTVFVHHTHIA